VTRTHPGNAAPTRTPTGCCASTPQGHRPVRAQRRTPRRGRRGAQHPAPQNTGLRHPRPSPGPTPSRLTTPHQPRGLTSHRGRPTQRQRRRLRRRWFCDARAGYGAAPQASRVLRTALRATRLAARPGPPSLCDPSDRKHGQAQPAPPHTRASQHHQPHPTNHYPQPHQPTVLRGLPEPSGTETSAASSSRTAPTGKPAREHAWLGWGEAPLVLPNVARPTDGPKIDLDGVRYVSTGISRASYFGGWLESLTQQTGRETGAIMTTR